MQILVLEPENVSFVILDFRKMSLALLLAVGSDSPYNKKAEIYSRKRNAWSEIADHPDNSRKMISAAAITLYDGAFYVFGGKVGTGWKQSER